jgi:Glycosyltransferase family 87/WD40-like Beta Propeller Repeat
LATRLNLKTTGLTLVAVVLAGHLILSPIRQGWSGMFTDFPNHYVAAVLTLHHQPLRQFYDWEWFQRQVHYAGIERQLSGYAPYTPLTMLPYLPLAGLQPQRAKQVWIAAETIFLAAAIWLLARLTGLGVLKTLVLALLAHAALSSNFLLGHYYIFLMLLLACAAWCLLKGRDAAGGALLGLIFALKLYAAPFIFYFAVRRQWRAFWGMLGSVALLTLAAIAIFGWKDVWFFATNILPRGIDGAVVDPYNPGLGSAVVFLRRIFVPEPELNPHPLLNAPAAFFFLRALYTLGVLGFALLALPKAESHDRAFAWFVIVLFALSPVTATYHFILLLVPVAILLRGESLAWSAGLIALYILVELPLRPSYSWLFPKVWLLLGLLLYTGWRFLRPLRIGPAAIVLALSAAEAYFQWTSYRAEPHEHAVIQTGAIFSSASALSPGQIVYESMADDRFVLRSDSRIFEFEGHALHPSVPLAGAPIYFELLTGGHSQIRTTTALEPIALDAIEPAISPDGTRLAYISHGALVVPQTGLRLSGEISGPAFFPDNERIAYAEGPPGSRRIAASGDVLTHEGDCFEPAVAPDGSTVAFACTGGGGSQIWLFNLKARTRRQITHGACNNTHPAWASDSRSIVFSSDCNRGVELPALLRAIIAE